MRCCVEEDEFQDGGTEQLVEASQEDLNDAKVPLVQEDVRDEMHARKGAPRRCGVARRGGLQHRSD